MHNILISPTTTTTIDRDNRKENRNPARRLSRCCWPTGWQSSHSQFRSFFLVGIVPLLALFLLCPRASNRAPRAYTTHYRPAVRSGINTRARTRGNRRTHAREVVRARAPSAPKSNETPMTTERTCRPSDPRLQRGGRASLPTANCTMLLHSESIAARCRERIQKRTGLVCAKFASSVLRKSEL